MVLLLLLKLPLLLLNARTHALTNTCCCVVAFVVWIVFVVSIAWHAARGICRFDSIRVCVWTLHAIRSQFDPSGRQDLIRSDVCSAMGFSIRFNVETWKRQFDSIESF